MPGKAPAYLVVCSGVGYNPGLSWFDRFAHPQCAVDLEAVFTRHKERRGDHRRSSQTHELFEHAWSLPEDGIARSSTSAGCNLDDLFAQLYLVLPI